MYTRDRKEAFVSAVVGKTFELSTDDEDVIDSNIAVEIATSILLGVVIESDRSGAFDHIYGIK